MLAIGRGLMANPKLLLLDEPSLGLAPVMVQQIRSILVEINASDTAVLLVEQNVQMALSIASYGYVLDEGEERSMATIRQHRPQRRWPL